MQIAIIDDGVNNYFSNAHNLCFDIEITPNSDVLSKSKYNGLEAKPTHGAICAAIIKKYAPDAEIGSIKILSDQTGKGDVNQLIEALNWCEKHGVQLIHASIGSERIGDYEKLKTVIERLSKKKSVIVSALSNSMNFSVPACIASVIGVQRGRDLKEMQFIPNTAELDGVEFTASSSHSLMNMFGNEYTTPICNSFAAPVITATVYKLLKCNPDLTSSQVKPILAGKPYDYFIASRPDFTEHTIPIEQIDCGIDIQCCFLSQKSTIEQFQKAEKNIFGIVCEGDLPDWSKEFCQRTGSFMWSEGLYEQLVSHTRFTTDEMAAPLICIVGDNEMVLRVATEMVSCFLEFGYDCRAFSNISCSYLFDIDWIPSCISCHSFLVRQIKKMSLDVAILCMEISTDYLYADACVVIGKQTSPFPLNSKHILKLKGYSLSKVKKIVRRLIHLLS